METEAIITRFISDELLRGDGEVSLEPDSSLISTGILDSLALLKLLLFIEERFQVKVEDGEVNPSNFETINRIKAFVESKSERTHLE
jgi:acyl carrier protein